MWPERGIPKDRLISLQAIQAAALVHGRLHGAQQEWKNKTIQAKYKSHRIVSLDRFVRECTYCLSIVPWGYCVDW